MKRALRWRLPMAGLLLGVALSAPAKPPAPALKYEVDQQTLALGEPLQLRITRSAHAAGLGLDSLDLRPLQRDFEITERLQGSDGQRETLTLVLHARHAGRITLPVPGQRGLRVTVTDGSRTVSRVRWKLGVDPVEPLLRQPVTFTLEACDDGSLLWKRPQLPSVEGLLLRPLGETEIITTRDGQRCTAHRWHWALLPTAVGPHALPLPMLEAGKFGRRLRFAAPALALTVQPLPAWLPGEVAVGRPAVRAEPLPAQAALGQPMAWRWELEGAWSERSLQGLLSLQLRTTDPRLGLERYAPQVEALSGVTAAPRWRVTLYLLPQARGPLELPALQLPWYDPASGQLERMPLPAPTIAVLDPQRARWLLAAQGLFFLLVVALLAWGGWRLLAWRVRRHRAMQRILRAPDAEAFRRALLSFSLQPGQPPAPTLQAWHERMAAQCRAGEWAELVATLERARYGHARTDLLQLRRLASAGLRRAAPR